MADPRVVGRDREIAEIESALDRAADGRRGVVLIHSRPGLGASTLLSIAVGKARGKGFRVLLAAAHEFESRWPFATIAELLDLRASDVDPIRSRLQSELVQHIEADVDQPNEPAFAKRMVDALLGIEGPTLIAIDDLHFADDQSIATLNRGLRRARDQGLAVVITSRDGEPRSRVLGFCDSLRGEGTSVMRLEPLDADETKAMAETLLGAPPSEELTRRLSGAGGYPLWVTEFVESAVAESSIAIDRVALLSSSVLPHDFAQHAISRTSALSERSREAIEWLAAARGGSTELVARLTEKSTQAAADALKEAALVGFLSEHDGIWSFEQEIVREAVCQSVPTAVLNERHVAIAEHLEALAAPPEAIVNQLLSAAGVVSVDIVPTLRDVASRLIGRAPFEALRLLRRADEIAETTGEPRVEVLLQRVRAALSAGAARDAINSAQTLLDMPEAKAVHEEARKLLARGLLLQRRFEESVGVIAALRSRDQADIAFESLASAWSFDMARTERCLEAIEPINGVDDETALLAGAARASALHITGRVDQAADLAGEVFTEAGGTGAMASRIRWMFCEFMTVADRLRDSQRMLAGEETRAASATPSVAAGLLYVSGLNAYLLGDWQHVDRCLQSARAIDPDADSAWIEPELRMLEALVALHRDEIDAAERSIADLIENDRASDPDLGLQLLALQVALPSPRRPIRQLLDEAEVVLSDARSRGVQNLHWQLCLPLARAAVANEHTRVADACVEITAEVASLNDLPSAAASAKACRALIHSDPETAKEAVTIVEHSPRRVLQAEIKEVAGTILASSGQRREASDLLVAALRIGDELGAKRDCARLVSILRPLGVTRQKLVLTSAGEGGWESLTPGEWRVVRLAARGHTTPAIAERLFLSPRTVQTHLRSSFRKLGVSTRAELAAVVSNRLSSVEGSDPS